MADGEIVERLVTEWDANTDKILAKLNGLNRTVHGHAADIEKAFGNIDVGKALDKVFDESRLTLLNAGAARLRIFGSALEPLGPLGIAAAAGVAGLGIALEMSSKALDFAHNLETTAAKLGLTTTQLQEYDFMALKSGVSTDVWREAILKGTEVFGAFLSNVGDVRIKQAFAALGISKDQARDLATFSNALPVIADRIRGIGNEAEQAQIAKKLGLEAMLPALVQGGDYIKGMQKEAERLGLVLDAGAVHAAAELNGQVKIAVDQVGVNLKRAFIELGPIVVAIANTMAKMAEYAADTVENLKGTSNIDLSIDPSGFSKGHLERSAAGTLGEMQSRQALLKAQGARFNSAGRMVTPGVDGGANDSYNAVFGEFVKLGTAYAARIKNEDSFKPGAAPPAVGLVPEKHKKGPADKTDELNKTADEDLDKAVKELADAYKGLAGDIQKRADFEIQAHKAEADAQQAKLKLDLEKLAKDKTISAPDRAADQGKIEKAQADVELARIAKDQLVQRTADFAIEDRQIEIHKAVVDAQLAQLQTEADLLPLGAARVAVERHILELRQQLARDLEGTALDRQVKTGEISPGQRSEQFGALVASQGADTGAFNVKNENPLAAYIRQASGQVNSSSGGLTNSLDDVAVSGLKALNTQLASAIVNSKNLGDVLKNVFKDIEQQLIQLALEKYLTIPLAQALGLATGQGQGIELSSMLSAGNSIGASNLIPAAAGGSGGGGDGLIPGAISIAKMFGFLGFARGTDSAPGGLSIVGEDGPEIMNVPKGAQVVPNNLLASLGRGVTSGMAGGSTTVINNAYEIKGAVMTSDLVDQMNAIGQRAAVQGAALGVQTARQIIPREMSRRASLQLG